ncbi:hypothetical protein M2360_002788 [Rhizobium sp. SG_E_25_P2]|uniref:hypothetical protein n=1 Tax=Rhizobium sp. SG_E_25_P2 TaxID=2879942 RepID=UPI002473C403|nr:hypothetical protein [Rhizobium sp. SG_E_25_P2]MDH6267391.1 hypothetical protein [Rhizobium sp. SG_E_25_P2]
MFLIAGDCQAGKIIDAKSQYRGVRAPRRCFVAHMQMNINDFFFPSAAKKVDLKKSACQASEINFKIKTFRANNACRRVVGSGGTLGNNGANHD